MRATNFEYRHQTLLSQLIIAAGLATYLFDPEDVVWRFIKASANRRILEHAVFVAAGILIGAGAALCTRARTAKADDGGPVSAEYQLGELLYAVGLGTLMPLAGFLIVVTGQAIRILRVMGSERGNPERTSWAGAMRSEAAKWGLLVTMIVFSITLIDRQADVLAGASYLVWLLLNLSGWRRSIN